MKTLILKTINPLVLFIVFFAASIFLGCEKGDHLIVPDENIQLKSVPGMPGQPGCDPVYIPLIAAQNSNVGYLIVSNDAEVLNVKYDASDSHTISEVHLWAGTEIANVPMNKNKVPVPGKFPYHAAGLDTYSFTINLAEIYKYPEMLLEGKPIYLFAYAVLVNNETGEQEAAWSAGETFGSKRWGMYSEFQCCPPDGNPSGCFPHIANCGSNISGVFYYDNRKAGDQLISADNGEVAGTVKYANGKFYFNFSQSWMFNSSADNPVLINGYFEPDGEKTELYTGGPTLSYGEITVPVSFYRFYELQLMIQYCR